MRSPLSADDLMPLVASLTDIELIRLLKWITSRRGEDTLAYRAAPPTDDEFSSEHEALAWDADGWERREWAHPHPGLLDEGPEPPR